MEYVFCTRCGNPLKSSTNQEWDFECSKCNQKYYNNPTPVVAALVFMDGKLVTARSKNRGLWGLPAGFVSKNEDLEQAVIREIFEETNLNVRVTGFHASYPMVVNDRNLLFIVFTAEVESGTPRAGDDVLELKILDPEDAFKKLEICEYASKALERWLQIT